MGERVVGERSRGREPTFDLAGPRVSFSIQLEIAKKIVHCYVALQGAIFSVDKVRK